MRLLFSIFLTIFLSSATMADTTLRGRVVQAIDHEGVAGANVLIKNREGKMATFGTTDPDGNFSITLRTDTAGLTVNVTMLGFAPFSRPLSEMKQPLEIVLEEGSLQLKEVVVKGRRINERGDTITYDVGSFAQKQDRSIGDVLRRMPGINVADNGKIQYQGVDINKFYIEGSDLLSGKYGIATNGISHEDVGAVEVMENHQPMRVLQGISFSNQAAVNLKLKNRAKATLLCHGTAAAGVGEQPKGILWEGDVFTMMVKGSYQMITTLKGNNTGNALADQLIDFTTKEEGEDIKGYLSLRAPTPPDFKRNRTLFNRSALVSSNHLFKTSRGVDVKAQIDYGAERATSGNSLFTTYFLDSGDRTVVEERNSRERSNTLTGKFSFELNEKSFYLSNTLSTGFSWRDRTLSTTGSLPNDQDADIGDFAVSNHLKVIKRIDNRLVTFTSRNEWHSLPERLRVGQAERFYGERISQYSFLTDERASFGLLLKRVTLSLEGGVGGYFRKLSAGLWGETPFYSDIENGIHTDFLRLHVSPKLEWAYRRLEMTISLPLNLYTYFFSRDLRNRTELFVSPSIGLKFKVVQGLSMALRGSLRRTPASLHDLYTGVILTDYRTFSEGTGDYYPSSGENLNASCFYRDTRNGLFIMGTAGMIRNSSKTGKTQYVEGDYVYNSIVERPSRSRSIMAMLNASKTLDFIRGSGGLRGSFMRTSNTVVSQGTGTNFRNDMISLAPYVNGNISSWVNWTLGFAWDRTALGISGMPLRGSDRFTYSGHLTVTPCRLLTWTTGGEYYRSEVREGYFKDMLMIDTKLTFSVSKMVEIEAVGSNLLNKREYSYVSYGTLTECLHRSSLRGREFLVRVVVKK